MVFKPSIKAQDRKNGGKEGKKDRRERGIERKKTVCVEG